MNKKAGRVLVLTGATLLLVWLVGFGGIAMGQAEIEASVVYEKGKYYGYRIPSVIVSKSRTVLAFAERRVGLHDHAQNDIVLKRSSDGGRSWGSEIIVQEDGKNVLVNPCAVVLESGRILLMYQWFQEGYHARSGPHMKLLETGLTGEKVSHTLITISDDDGVTWSQPRDVTASTKRPEVNSTATGPGIGIVLTRGKYAGRIVMPTNEGWWVGKNWYFRIYVVYSDDNGSVWQYGDPVPSGDGGYGNECQVVELSDGTLLFNSRSFSGRHFRKVSRSKDGGQTWSPLVDDETLIEPECMGSILRYSWPETGKSVLLFANPASQSERESGTIRMSFDEGHSWPVSKMVVPGPYAYSCLTRLPDGHIGLLYEADRYGSIRFVRFGLAWVER